MQVLGEPECFDKEQELGSQRRSGEMPAGKPSLHGCGGYTGNPCG